MEAGPIHQTYDEWVESCARPRRWIDGPGYIAAATVLERRILVQKFLDGRWCRVALYEPHESNAKANMTARKHPVLPLFLRDQHLTTVIPCSHHEWPEEWAEPIEKVLEKQADMRAAGFRVRSERSTSSLFTGTISPATIRSRPICRKSGSQNSRRRARVILPVSAMFDDAPPAVSCQDTPVRSARSRRTARTEKSLFAGSISTEMSSKARATANTSVRVHSCLASDEIPDFLAAARDPGGDEHRWTCRICHHTLSSSLQSKAHDCPKQPPDP